MEVAINRENNTMAFICREIEMEEIVETKFVTCPLI
jgi:hypothetical protein